MNIIRRMTVAGMLAAVALQAWAGPGSAPASASNKPKFDVTGTWNAKVESGRGPAMNLVIVLKQEKDKLTGTVSANGGPPVEISDGKVYRTTIAFSVSTTFPAMPAGPNQKSAPQPMTMVTKYTGTVDDNIITMSSSMGGMGGMGGPPGGGGMGGMKTTFTAQRQ